MSERCSVARQTVGESYHARMSCLNAGYCILECQSLRQVREVMIIVISTSLPGNSSGCCWSDCRMLGIVGSKWIGCFSRAE